MTKENHSKGYLIMKKLSILISLLISLSGCTLYGIPRATVMITNLKGSSGGSGTILRSYPNYSEILTNAHVCEVTKRGGIVHSYQGDATVINYVQSEIHDLCLIKAASDLGINTDVASSPAGIFRDISVSGHPNLLPTIITKGMYSGNIIIQVMGGTRKCTEQELKDPVLGLVCNMLVEIPMIKSFEASVVSATIMPGSSGSGVFNSSEDLVAVIFAGRDGFGYGFAVPYEYVKQFVDKESKILTPQFPDTTVEFSSTESRATYINRTDNICLKLIPSPKAYEMCMSMIESVKNTMDFRR